MIEDPELEKRRKEFYAAQNLFHVDPNPTTKEGYKKASSAFNVALHHAGHKTDDTEGCAQAEPVKVDSGISAEDAETIEAARLAQNAAHRAMYASPGPETREKWKEARNNYKKVRRSLDPAFRAALSESTRKSLAKSKA